MKNLILKHLNLRVILNMYFLRRGVVSSSPNPQAGRPPLVGCPRLLIRFIHSYSPYRRPFLHPQPEDAPCRGDRVPHSWVLPFMKTNMYDVGLYYPITGQHKSLANVGKKIAHSIRSFSVRAIVRLPNAGTGDFTF